jgi:hypothetical protein
VVEGRVAVVRVLTRVVEGKVAVGAEFDEELQPATRPAIVMSSTRLRTRRSVAPSIHVGRKSLAGAKGENDDRSDLDRRRP